jgi:hypothetical protein
MREKVNDYRGVKSLLITGSLIIILHINSGLASANISAALAVPNPVVQVDLDSANTATTTMNTLASRSVVRVNMCLFSKYLKTTLLKWKQTKFTVHYLLIEHLKYCTKILNLALSEPRPKSISGWEAGTPTKKLPSQIIMLPFVTRQDCPSIQKEI